MRALPRDVLRSARGADPSTGPPRHDRREVPLQSEAYAVANRGALPRTVVVPVREAPLDDLEAGVGEELSNLLLSIHANVAVRSVVSGHRKIQHHSAAEREGQHVRDRLRIGTAQQQAPTRSQPAREA